ncbi:hypothetical protein KY335_04575 [Candidatus Woesearchaeota archaeon]|nr:hypothetical protein [Candidatus Woesearchaeota archaeon]
MGLNNMFKGTKAIITLMLLVFAVFAAVPSTEAVGILFDTVKMNGDTISDDEIISVERDSDLDIRLRILGLDDVENLRVEALVSGYEYEQIRDSTAAFEVDAGEIYTKDLSLHIPANMPNDDFLLRLIAYNRDDITYEQNYNINIDSKRHDVRILDVILSPGATLEAGTSLLTTVKTWNAGSKFESGKVTVSIPDLNIEQSAFVTMEPGEARISEELFMRLPRCAEAKEYTAVIEYTSTTVSDRKEKTINVLPSALCPSNEGSEEDRTMVAIGTTNQVIAHGESMSYPITITNAGSEAKQYRVEVGNNDWAFTEISPIGDIYIPAGDSQTVHVIMSPKATSAGKNIFTVQIFAENEMVKQVPLAAEIAGKAQPAEGKSRLTILALEIVLGIIIVVLILLAFTAIARKRRESLDEEDFGDQEETIDTSYY